MKKEFPFIFLLISTFFWSCTTSKKVSQASEFNGYWVYKTNSSVFDLFLKLDEKIVTGSYCSVMLNGNRIDCSDDEDESETSFAGVLINNETINIDFVSSYSGTVGKAKLKKINSNKIEWKIIEKPDGIFFIPDSVVLIKQKRK